MRMSQIALAKAVGIGDTRTTTLLEDISKYQRCVSFLKKLSVIEPQDIVYAHGLLFSDNRLKGRLRSYSSSVQVDSNGTLMSHENPDNLVDRISEILDFANDNSQPILNRAINSYFKLLHVHPFKDGNGRLARAIVQSLLGQTGRFEIHPCLYRFQCSPATYFSSVKTSSERKFNHHQEAYYIEAKSWADTASLKVTQICDSAIKIFHQKLGLYNLQENEKKLLDTLWESPVLLGNDMEIKTKKAISNLIEFKILKAQRLSFSSQTIFVCDDILDCWDSLDNLLIKN